MVQTREVSKFILTYIATNRIVNFTLYPKGLCDTHFLDMINKIKLEIKIKRQ